MAGPVLRTAAGERIDLGTDRWRNDPDPEELGLLLALPGPVLDIGCGPGRVPATLAAAGTVALGIDPSPVAAGEARQRGAPVLERSVFAPLPGEGRWATALLLDGNIGIGGDPLALLVRIAALLAPTGELLAEVEGPGIGVERFAARVEHGERIGPWFPWARVGVDGFADLAAAAGLAATGVTVVGGRWFARATRR